VAAYVQAASLPAFRWSEIDCHIGSQITETAPYLDALDGFSDLVEAVEAHDIPIHHLDLGGGLGIGLCRRSAAVGRSLVIHCWLALTRAAMAIARSLFEARALAGRKRRRLIGEVLFLKPGDRRISASLMQR